VLRVTTLHKAKILARVITLYNTDRARLTTLRDSVDVARFITLHNVNILARVITLHNTDRARLTTLCGNDDGARFITLILQVLSRCITLTFLQSFRAILSQGLARCTALTLFDLIHKLIKED
jgi:hypothetical protein